MDWDGEDLIQFSPVRQDEDCIGLPPAVDCHFDGRPRESLTQASDDGAAGENLFTGLASSMAYPRCLLPPIDPSRCHLPNRPEPHSDHLFSKMGSREAMIVQSDDVFAPASESKTEYLDFPPSPDIETLDFMNMVVDKGRDVADIEDNGEKYRLVSAPAVPKRVSERKRTDAAIFEAWLKTKEKSQAFKKQRIEVRERVGRVKSKMTTASLVRQSQSRRIVDSPREYQIELFERAKEKNTIIVLDTGSGKTLIAILLLRHAIEHELERRAAGYDPKISFFLVDKVALVDQQWSALVANLPYPVARFFGKELDSNWNPDFWRKAFDENKVIVCTAAILQKALSHSFVKIKQINLLIIDEAHHAKKNHPYARIIKDYYLKEKDLRDRPRILGMTASPVDGKADIQAAAEQLEALLCSQIATVSTGKLNDEMGIRIHDDVVLEFKKLEKRFDTSLVKSIEPLTKYNPMFTKHVEFSKVCTYELGPWCTDRFWKLCFADGEMPQLIAKAEAVAQQTFGQIPFLPDGMDPVSAIHRLGDVMREHSLRSLERVSEDLSSKTLLLLRKLEEYFTRPSDHKCIIFVERRRTAVMLVEICQQLSNQFPYLKPGYLIGHSNDMGLAGISYRDAVLAIHRFRKSEINCLFASSIAEEGIDIPDCDIIIRFDVCQSMIQYIQSKGRARHHQSVYINMVEEGNHTQATRLAQASHDTTILRKFCSKLPENRRLDSNLSRFIDWQGDLGFKTYIIKETGATLTLSQSLNVLDAFTASFQVPSGPPIVPQYAITKVGKLWVAQVNLPEQFPIRSMLGEEHKSKQAAKCSAAFTMCLELIKKQFINTHLQPTMKKRLPAMRNARLKLSENKRQQYKMLLKPSLWSTYLGQPDRLYGLVLVLENPAAISRASCPLVLLSRMKLPSLPDVPLFFGAGKNSVVRPVQLDEPMTIVGAEDEERLEGLRTFTIRIFDDVFSKSFDATPAELPYFLAPCSKPHEHKFSEVHNPKEVIDWEAIDVVKTNERLEISEGDDPVEFYRDRYVTDPYSGSRKLYSIGVREDLKPLDPVPEGVPPPAFRGWKTVEHNIKEYSISIWSRTRAQRTWKEDQPVVEAELVSLRRNLLDNFEDDDDEPKACYVMMEPLHVSALPVQVVAMAFTFPAIIHRIDSVLIALEAADKLGLKIRSDLALEAVTKDSDNTNEHGEHQVNFQGGMGRNYERAEFLGDAFLKMATTIVMFTQRPDKDEFDYHVERMLLLCNQNLFNTAVDMGLQEYVRSKSFNRRTWYPAGLRLTKGKAPQEEAGHSLADKSLADVCEAFIGAAYLSYSNEEVDKDSSKMPDFDMAVKAVTAVVKSKKHQMQSWSDYFSDYKVPDWQAIEPSASQVEVAKLVQQNLGYEFKYPALLRSAFKHPSYPYEKIPNYQRLEFLGDAILDMVCVDFLFKKFPDADPQWLTEHKTAMVSNQFLGCLCVELGLHRHMLSIHAALMQSVKTYAEDIELARQEAIEAARAEGGGDKDKYKRSFWVNVPSAPKCLPDIVEAYVGAMFVDSGFDYTQVRQFFERHIRPYFEDMSLYDSFANSHPVTIMAHRLAQEFGCKEWRVLVKEDAPEAEEAGVGCLTDIDVVAGVLIHGVVFAAGRGESGRFAKKDAAKVALGCLDEIKLEEFKERFRCECTVEDAAAVSMEQHGTAI